MGVYIVLNSNIKNEDRKKKLLIIYLVIFAGLGGVLYGYDIGVIAGALLFIDKAIPMSSSQLSLIVGAVLGGGSIAILIAGVMADYFGRKKIIIFSAIIFLIGVLLVSIANSFTGLLIGRLVQGIGVGIITIVIPLYLTETMPARIRGRCVAVFQLFLTGGILLAYVVDLFFTPSGNWRAMFCGVSVPGLLLLVGSFFIPESPSWYFLKKKEDKARKILLKINSSIETNEIITKMHDLKRAPAKNDKKQQKEIFKKAYLLPFFIALSIAVLTQLTGINTFIQYCPYIFKHCGINSNAMSMNLTVEIGILQFIVTLIAISLIDKKGRRFLLIIGTLGIITGMILMAISTALQAGNFKVSLLVIGMLIFRLFYSFGPGIIVWLILGEILPVAIRGKGMAICLFVNSMVSTILASVFMNLVSFISYGGTFIMFALFTLIYCYIVIYWLPETKGKTLEEIEEYFERIRNKKLFNI
jgi:MFS transporter, SP family, galactose:H+ symporter